MKVPDQTNTHMDEREQELEDLRRALGGANCDRRDLYISRLLGGSKTLLLGNLIEMKFLGNAYNPHLGSSISLVMMVIVMISMAVMNRFGEGEEGAVVF